MISNQVLQNTIEGLKAITRVELCVLGTDGEVLAATLEPGQESIDAAVTFVDSPAESQSLAGYQFFKVYDDNLLEFVVFAK